MNKQGSQPGIKEKTEIYEQAARYLGEGRLFPFIVSELSEKYNTDTDTVSKIVTDAQNKHWDHLQDKTVELMVQEKTYPEITEQLRQEEPDNEVVEYIVKTYSGFYAEAEEKNIPVQQSPVLAGLALIVFGVILYLFYHDNAYGILKIIGWILFAGALFGFIISLNQYIAEKRNK